MAVYNPIYYLTVYAHPSVDPTETTILTPAANSVHSEPFKIASAQVSGWRPLITKVGSLTQTYKPQTGDSTIASTTVDISDVRLTATNFQRWFTAYVGDINGVDTLTGCSFGLEVSYDNGVTKAAWFGGRIHQWALTTPTTIQLTLNDPGKELAWKQFRQMPFPSASGFVTSLCPIGMGGTYPPFNVLGKVSAGVMDYNATGVPLSGSVTAVNSSTGVYTFVVDYGGNQNPSNRITDSFNNLLAKMPVAGGAAGYIANNFIYQNYTVNSGSTIIVELGTLPPSKFGYFTLKSMQRTQGVNNVSVVGQFDFISGSTAIGGKTSDFPLNQRATWRIMPYSLAVSKDNPIWLPAEHPLKPALDMLNGYYGFMNASGSPYRVYNYDSASFSTLLSDNTFGSFRMMVDAPTSFLDFWKKNITNYGLGYCFVPSYTGSLIRNVFTPLDNRVPPLASVTTTLTDSDVLALTSVTATSAKPITSITINSKDEAIIPMTTDGTAIPPTRIVEADETTQEIIAENLLVDGQDISIDAPSIRVPDSSLPGAGWTLLPSVLPQAPWQIARDQADNDINNMLNYFYQRFGGQGITYTMDCRRTTNTNTLRPGQWVFMNISVVPDLTNHVRNGTRLVQITERSENGYHLAFKAIDAGINVNLPKPVVSAVQSNYAFSGNSDNSLWVTVACPSASVRLAISLAEVATSGSQPGSGSGKWMTKVNIPNVQAYGVGNNVAQNYRVFTVKNGVRYYARAQVFSLGGMQSSVLDDTALPHCDMPAILAPTSLFYGGLNAQPFVSWSNNGDTTSQIMVQVAQPSTGPNFNLDRMMAGSTKCDIHYVSNDPSLNPIKVSVSHMDGISGLSPSSSVTFSLSSSNQPVAQVKQAYYPTTNAFPYTGTSPDRYSTPTGILVGIVPTDVDFDIEIQRAPAFGGSSGSWTQIAYLYGAQLASEGNIYQNHLPYNSDIYDYRVAQHNTYTQSAWTQIGQTHAVHGFWQYVPGAHKPVAQFSAQTNDSAGQLISYGVSYVDMGNGTPIIHNPQSFDLQNNQSFTFNPSYQNQPTFYTTNYGLLNDQTASIWNNTGAITGSGTAWNVARPAGTTDQIIGVRNLSSTGGTSLIALHIRGGTTLTARSNAFAGSAVTTVGGTQLCTLANAPAVGDSYTVNGTCNIDATGGANGTQATCTWVTEVFAAGVWNQVKTQTLSALFSGIGNDTQASNSTTFANNISYSGLISTSQIRLRLTAISSYGTVTVSLAGTTVTYNTSAAANNDYYTPAVTGSINDSRVTYTFFTS